MEYRGSTYVFHQSWIGQFLLCPESGRLAAFHPQLSDSPIRETDASVLGTATHKAIEIILLGGSYREGLDAGVNLIDTTEFRAVQTKRKSTMYAHLETMVTAWQNDLQQVLYHPLKVEYEFCHPITNTITLEGHVDCEDPYAIYDWKTAGRSRWEDKYAPWMARKLIQPTVYTAQRAGYHVDNRTEPEAEAFGYGILIKGPTPEAHLIPTERHAGDWRFLVHQLERLVRLYETLGPDEPWPVHDSGWHCSEKWCDFWWTCKGRIVDAEGYQAHAAANASDVHVGTV